MTIERSILACAGTAIPLSLGLGSSVSPYWYWFTAFVGFNLLQSAFTRVLPPGYHPQEARTQIRKRVLSRNRSVRRTLPGFHESPGLHESMSRR